MYALSGAPSTHRRASPAVYRRRRVLAVVGAAVVLVTLAAIGDTAAGGTTGRAVLERVVAIGVVVLWAHCALALWRWNRAASEATAVSTAASAGTTGSPAVSGAGPGGSCLPPGSAPVLSPRRHADVA